MTGHRRMCVAINAAVASGDPLKPTLESDTGVGRLFHFVKRPSIETVREYGTCQRL